MATTFVLGMNGKMYIGADEDAVAALVEMSNAQDVTTTLEAGEADITTRANQGWRATAPTLKECTIEFEMIWLPGDSNFELVKAAFLGNTTVQLLVLDGPKDVAGNSGPHGLFGITSFSRSEALEEAMTVSVTAKLAAVIAGGTGFYTVGGA